MKWYDEYKSKFVAPEDAVKVIKSGDTVCIPIDTKPQALSKALMSRNEELENVTIMVRQPEHDVGWLQGDFGDAFNVVLDAQVGIGAQALNENRLDYIPYLTSLRFKGEHDSRREGEGIDVVMIVVSPPDKEGFCRFGLYLSHKKDYAMRAQKVLAEVSDAPGMMVQVPGDNHIHVSQIDFFVEHIPFPHQRSRHPQPTDIDRSIAEYVATIVRDGDTLQLGPGSVTSLLTTLGAFNDRHDLGIHSPIIGPELLELVRRGIVNGKQKNVNTGKAVSGGFRRINCEEDLAFIDQNPAFEVRNMSYVNDIRIIASNDRLVAINSVLAVDFAGQLAADSLGKRMWGGAGGQVDFVIGAMLSNGGCSITALHSTDSKGAISRIVGDLDKGTIVSIPHTFADYVVTEYGIAKLWGKSRKERARELIAIAHPDFRSGLMEQARSQQII